MQINPLGALSLALPETHPGNNGKDNSFGQLVNDSLNELNKTQINADRTIKDFLTGNVENLHQVVVTLEEARFTMQLAVQIRNKLLESYQEMMRMQV